MTQRATWAKIYVGPMDIRVSEDPADAAAAWMAGRLRDAVRRRGHASVAVSGGSTAPPMFAALVDLEVPWERIVIWQVDERVAADGSSDRNAIQLASFPGEVRLMPVTSPDLRAAARDYAQHLPDRFDVVHLGLGDDGHTASWPPGDEVIDSRRNVEVTREFNGRIRMTLTPGAVNAARSRLMLAVGIAKAAAVEGWLLRDASLPVVRVRQSGTIVFLDPEAASRLPM